MNENNEQKPVDVPALYPHQKLDHVAMQDPESVLRWAGTWLNGEAAHHGEMLRAAADIVTKREAAVAELLDKADTAEKALRNLVAAGQIDTAYKHYADDLRAALARVGGAG